MWIASLPFLKGLLLKWGFPCSLRPQDLKFNLKKGYPASGTLIQGEE